MSIKVAIDLTWIRHGVVGGTEAYAMNLLRGLLSINDPCIEYLLLVAKDNYFLFEQFEKSSCFSVYIAKINSANRFARIMWENCRLSSVLLKQDIKTCIVPMYLKPYIASSKIRFITTVHDLQASHYPEYFSPLFVCWMKIGWKNAVYTSEKVMVTSDYSRRDIQSSYNVDSRKLVLNYDPVVVEEDNISTIERLKEFSVRSNEYYYMVSSLSPHKNIDTIVKALSSLKRKESKAFLPLVISGVGGKERDKLIKLARDNDIADMVIMTPFIGDDDRNLLYKHCKVFLAPSLFEGFGLPPVEAMIMGAPLLSTYETCSYEISEGIAEYVDNARNPEEWASRLDSGVRKPDYRRVLDLKEKYSKENVAKIFISTIKEIEEGINK